MAKDSIFEKMVRNRGNLFLWGALFVVSSILLTSLTLRNSEEGGFILPLNILPAISGTFGELRGSHFHSGIDFKTGQQEGLPVMASAGGFVSRIKVSPWGYGKAIYITHPDGYTTVYAHLQSFSPAVEAYVQSMQYQRMTYEIELFPLKHMFPVTRGEIIGYSGNTGSSSAPHLHFEIRETQSETPLNPLAFDLPVPDHKPPMITRIAVYPLAEYRRIAQPEIYRVIPEKGNFRLAKNLIEVNSHRIGIGISTYDQLDGSSNKNGVYKIEMKVDGQTHYIFQADRISFSETRYLLAHVDYATRQRKQITLHRCFLLPGNKLSAYRNVKNRGMIDLEEGNARLVEIAVSDYAGNVQTIKFHLRYNGASNVFTPGTGYYTEVFAWDQDNTFDNEEISLYFPAGTFYDTLYFQYDRTPAQEPGIFSRVHRIHHPYEPLHSYYDIKIKPSSIPADLKDKALIVIEDGNGGITALDSEWRKDQLCGRAREFGKCYVTIDTTAPRITPVELEDSMEITAASPLRFIIEDDLSGIDFYKPALNGNWLLLAYDGKSNMLTGYPDRYLKEGKNTFTLTVGDKKGNISTFALTLFYKTE